MRSKAEKEYGNIWHGPDIDFCSLTFFSSHSNSSEVVAFLVLPKRKSKFSKWMREVSPAFFLLEQLLNPLDFSQTSLTECMLPGGWVNFYSLMDVTFFWWGKKSHINAVNTILKEFPISTNAVFSKLQFDIYGFCHLNVRWMQVLKVILCKNKGSSFHKSTYDPFHAFF